jgi:hypothetical protein
MTRSKRSLSRRSTNEAIHAASRSPVRRQLVYAMKVTGSKGDAVDIGPRGVNHEPALPSERTTARNVRESRPSTRTLPI